jgi:hypothetical protein
VAACRGIDRHDQPTEQDRNIRLGAPMHPHVFDAELGALAHGVLGELGPVPITTAWTPPGMDRRSL